MLLQSPELHPVTDDAASPQIGKTQQMGHLETSISRAARRG
jgi:hypothetical protein